MNYDQNQNHNAGQAEQDTEEALRNAFTLTSRALRNFTLV